MSNKLYNEEIKEKYLSQFENEQTQQTIRYVLYKAESEESRLDKDLFDFSNDDLKRIMKNSNPHNINVAKTQMRFLLSYINWALPYRKSNIPPVSVLPDEWYKDVIDRTKKIHFSKDEFYELIEELPNAQDQCFLALMFEGVIGDKFIELRMIKNSDINWDINEITLTERNNEIIKVDDKCMRYLSNSFKDNTYRNYNEETGEHSERELIQTDFLFRNVKSPRAVEGEPINAPVFYTRLNNIKKEFGLSYLTGNSIKQSGMLYMAAELFKEDGKLEYEQLEKIGEKYHYSKVTNNNYEYFNTSLMKEFINADKLKDLYDIDITQ